MIVDERHRRALNQVDRSFPFALDTTTLIHGGPLTGQDGETGRQWSITSDGMATKEYVLRPRKADDAYEKLKHLIVTLQLPPGSAINEQELIRQLTVSRTPFREAMLRLSHEGLILRAPRRGAWVSDLSITELQQLIDARSVVEPLVTRRAADRITPADADALMRIVDGVGQAVRDHDVETLVWHDLRFHSCVAKLSDNQYFAAFSRSIDTTLLRYWHLSFLRGGDFSDSFDHHRLLAEAIASRDLDLAEERAREHVEVFRNRIRDLVG
jgi:DNA-binding GntR family transcriptional regulator